MGLYFSAYMVKNILKGFAPVQMALLERFLKCQKEKKKGKCS